MRSKDSFSAKECHRKLIEDSGFDMLIAHALSCYRLVLSLGSRIPNPTKYIASLLLSQLRPCYGRSRYLQNHVMNRYGRVAIFEGCRHHAERRSVSNNRHGLQSIIRSGLVWNRCSRSAFLSRKVISLDLINSVWWLFKLEP